MPRKAPTFPRTCSAHRCASWFFCISWYAASACFFAAVAVAVAVDMKPPHQLPLDCAGSGAGFGGSSSVGAKLRWKLLALSADFLGGCALSSLVLADPVDDGVAMPVRRGLLEVVDDEDSLGVLGRLAGRRISGR
jgi:hypothetical protein